MKNIPELNSKIQELEKENERLKNILKNSLSVADNNEKYIEVLGTLKEHKKRENEISELLNAAYSILVSDDFTITAKRIFDSCAKTIGAKAGYVALLSDEGEENELLFLEDGGMRCTVDPNLPMPIRGLREEAYRNGKVVYDNNFMKSEWVKFMPKGHMALKNVLFSPLNIENKTVGIIGMACKKEDFNDNDAKLAAVFGEYAAIALQNSRRLEQLKQLNAQKDKFFSIISHDLISPFNSILGLSEMLYEQALEKDMDGVEKYANIVRNSSNKAVDLLTNLLDWSRSQRGKIDFNPSQFDLAKLVSEILILNDDLILSKEIQINNHIKSGVELCADKNMISTVIRNLFSNAIKFTHSKGKIDISVQENHDSVTFSIKDSGVGISKDHINKIFNIGESLSTEGTSNEKGTGLGLVLCKDFIKEHKGKISVDSEINKGSTFSFTLPKKEI